MMIHSFVSVTEVNDFFCANGFKITRKEDSNLNLKLNKLLSSTVYKHLYLYFQLKYFSS